jgi:hypothetical protein
MGRASGVPFLSQRLGMGRPSAGVRRPVQRGIVMAWVTAWVTAAALVLTGTLAGATIAVAQTVAAGETGLAIPNCK